MHQRGQRRSFLFSSLLGLGACQTASKLDQPPEVRQPRPSPTHESAVDEQLGATGERWHSLAPSSYGRVAAASLEKTGVTEAEGTAQAVREGRGVVIRVDLQRTIAGTHAIRIVDDCGAPPAGEPGCQPKGAGFVGPITVGDDGMGEAVYALSPAPGGLLSGRAIAIYGEVIIPSDGADRLACEPVACGTLAPEP